MIEVARQHGLAKQTVENWVSQLGPAGTDYAHALTRARAQARGDGGGDL
jgi:transposase-like protein